MGENFGVQVIFPLQYHKWPLEQMSIKVNDFYFKALLAEGPTTSIRCTLVQWNCVQSHCFVGNIGAGFLQERGVLRKKQCPWFGCIIFDERPFNLDIPASFNE